METLMIVLFDLALLVPPIAVVLGILTLALPSPSHRTRVAEPTVRVA
jgi:hypothetical protein